MLKGLKKAIVAKPKSALQNVEDTFEAFYYLFTRIIDKIPLILHVHDP